MPGPSRRRYSKAEKAQAVGQALATSTEAAAETLDVPESTIRYWVNHPEFADLRATTREQMADQLWATIQLAASEVAKGLRDPETPLRDKTVALGVLYDKHALLTGAATTRSESRDITGTLSDTDLIAAVREADRIAGGDGTPPAPAAEAAG